VYCSKCGGLVEDGIAFCPACGQPAGVTPAAGAPAALPASSYPGAGYPAVSQPVAPVVYAAPGVQFAGFWLRVVAYIIDSIVMGLAFMAIFIPFAVMTGLTAVLGNIHPGEDPDNIATALGGTFFLGLFALISLSIVGGWLYHAKMESSSWQATLGKRVLNLRVTDLNGARVTFGRASGRYFAKIITGLIPFGIGYMLAGLTERRQALHDMIASCLVLREN
jgi:uncharacterized RDD family membrane protein YckC